MEDSQVTLGGHHKLALYPVYDLSNISTGMEIAEGGVLTSQFSLHRTWKKAALSADKLNGCKVLSCSSRVNSVP